MKNKYNMVFEDGLTEEDIRAFEQSDIDIANGRVINGKVLLKALKEAYLSDEDFDEVALIDRIFEKNKRYKKN